MTTTYDVVKQICLGLPETEEIISHGFPHYKVRNKGFATYSVNHHGDGKVALLLNAAPESQQMLVESAPKHFFVPPYIGPRGWFELRGAPVKVKSKSKARNPADAKRLWALSAQLTGTYASAEISSPVARSST